MKNNDLDPFKPVAEAISLLLYPHAEVIIHDLKSQRISHIANNMSKRKIGDESLLEELGLLKKNENVFPPYTKINYDGRKMKSVSALLNNKAGNPVGLMCINLDISKWEQVHEFITDILQYNLQKPDYLFKNDWREKINTFVTVYLKKHGQTLKGLDRTEKKQLLLALLKEGAFESKNAAEYVAEVLQISRATVYNYLKESK